MSTSTRPPREDLIRAASPEVEQIELRAASEAGGPVMAGHFAVFNQWTEINSMWEGNFMERFVPGSFKKTISEGRDKMRVLFQHGQDPQVGDKPLGPIRQLGEDEHGAAYEVPLLDASYVRDQVLPGLQAGLYGASFRFKVMREEIVDEPAASEHNPHGLPERTVKEAQVMEFGPVTFPAYEGASAGVRSLTDEFLQRCLEQNPERLREMFEQDDVAASLSAITALVAESNEARERLLNVSQAEYKDLFAGFVQLIENRDAEASHLAEPHPVRTTPRPSLTSTAGSKFTLNPKEASWQLP